MLLYLSTPGNEALFSAWLEKQCIFMDYIDITQYPSLIAALRRNRALPNYTYIVFHFIEPPALDNLREAVAYIRQFHHARVIVFSPQCAETTVLFSTLADMGLRELVAINEEIDLLTELRECISQDGKGFLNAVEIAVSADIEAAQAKVRPKLSIPQGALITVGIAGTQTRAGVTTQAFCAYHALKALGLVPCIIDKKRAFSQMLVSLYSDEMVIDGSLFSIRDVTFANDIQIGTQYNAFITDFGVLSADIAHDFSSCDIRLLCSGAKAWEFPQLLQALRDYPKTAQRAVFSFVAESEENAINLIVKESIPAAFAPWSPDIWNAGGEWHERFLLPLIQEAIGR